MITVTFLRLRMVRKLCQPAVRLLETEATGCDDDLADLRPPELLPPVAVVPLLENRYPVPSQYRVGREQREVRLNSLTPRDKDRVRACPFRARITGRTHGFNL